MRLSDLIEARDIVIGVHATGIGLAAAQLLRETLPHRGLAAVDVERLVGEVLQREREAPTLCGTIAIPHARDPQLESFIAAVGINRAGVADGAPTPAVMIVFISPEAKRTEHLSLLASLARFGRDNAAVAKMAAATTVEEVMQSITAFSA